MDIYQAGVIGQILESIERIEKKVDKIYLSLELDKKLESPTLAKEIITEWVETQELVDQFEEIKEKAKR